MAWPDEVYGPFVRDQCPICVPDLISIIVEAGTHISDASFASVNEVRPTLRDDKRSAPNLNGRSPYPTKFELWLDLWRLR